MKNLYLNKLANVPTAWSGHGLFAIELVEKFKPDVIVDLGVDYGFSTFCFAYPKIGMVYGIDWFEGDGHAGIRNTFGQVKDLHKQLIAEFGIVNLDFIKSDFQTAADNWYKPIDILHIDGFHTYDAVKSDYENWIKFCNRDSIILFHDVVSFPDTVGVFFEECDGYKLIKKDSAGLGILTFSKSIHDSIENMIEGKFSV